ncbi:sp110 nuclear body protein-like isoform X1 [Tachysurus vachellii]|uniref:sp110 nuclear body protein-like isoform X1 n=1 Tax=Tachysurus vachellii TaxID=175792 RepID=UPI00296A8F97|nr:sp110 nuclear body protein-like isoform X1 [Tachysurus vachellii]
MDQLNFLTHDELVSFFRRKKAEISCMEEPHIFLRQLRDHDLVPEDLYKEVSKRRNKKRIEDGVYEILDSLENEGGDFIKRFWSCVFQDHIQQKYPVFRLLRNSIQDGSFRNYIKLPNAENPSGSNEGERQGKNQAQMKKAKKRKIADKKADEEEAGPSSGTRQKKADTEPKSSLLLHRGEVLVTCGDKRGTLDPDKLGKGEKCIFSEDRWFSPGEFERFSGKGSCKNWKTSIRYQNTTLQKLIKDGHLKCPRIYRRSRSKKKWLTVSLSSFSSVESSKSIFSRETDESSDEYITDDDDEEEEEEEEYSETAHLSTLLTLPVSCGSVSGVLHKSRFSGGSRSKSIRTEERWFTPEEFVKQELTLTDGHWKKDILCHGKTLDYLVKKKILQIHSVLCRCAVCHPGEKEQDNDDMCYICNSEGDLVCCDKCPRAYHHHCHLPTLQQEALGGSWLCTYCVFKNNHKLWIQMNRKGAMNSPVSMNMMRCEYLLLFLYKADTQRVLTDDPTKRMGRCTDVISEPMWLNKVKSKLQENKYTRVKEFVHDIRLIFKNCQTLNRGNKSDRMMAAKLFEQEFNSVFKIH